MLVAPLIEMPLQMEEGEARTPRTVSQGVQTSPGPDRSSSVVEQQLRRELAVARAQLDALEHSKRAPRGSVTPELGEILRRQRYRLGDLDRSPSPCRLESSPTDTPTSQPEPLSEPRAGSSAESTTECGPEQSEAPSDSEPQSEPQDEPRSKRVEPLELQTISPSPEKAGPPVIESIGISPSSCVFASPKGDGYRLRDIYALTPSPVRECILDLTPSPKRVSPKRATASPDPFADPFADFCSAQGFTDPRFQWLAREAFAAPLLPGWTESADGVFYDEWTGSWATDPPLDAVYRSLYLAATGRKRASEEEIMREIVDHLGEWVRYTCAQGNYWHCAAWGRSTWDNPQTRVDTAHSICKSVITRAFCDLDTSFCTAASSPAASVTPASTGSKRRSSRISRAL
jgi:hypothetical protein